MIKITNLQKRKPVILREGKFLTLENIISKKVDVSTLRGELENLSYSDKKKLVLERYKTVPKDVKIIEHVIGKGSFSLQQNTKEIEEDTDYGKELIDLEMLYISRLLRKYEEGEIE